MAETRTPEQIFDALCARVLTGAGVTSPAQRAAAAGVSDDGVPAAFARLLATIRKAAYRITDDDVRALQAAGVSDDAIYELTIATTVGVAQRRRASALAAIKAAT